MSAAAETGTEREAFLISDTPIDRHHAVLAGVTIAVLILALLAAAPFAAVPLPRSEPALPAYAAALLIVELLTAAMLMALFAASRRPSILILANGYLFSALLVIPWSLTFPGVFAAGGLMDAGLQTTAVIAAVRRLAFPIFVIAYALTRGGDAEVPRRYVRRLILAGIACAAIAVCGLIWLSVAAESILPHFMRNPTSASTLWLYVPSTSAVLVVVAIVALWSRRRRVLDLWLLVVMATLLIEIALLAFLSSGRLSLGWWAGRLYGLASSSTVLIILVASMTTVYARLMHSIASESRHRAARLATMEALAASIAHELNQPLASSVTNANAALRWLDRPEPDLDEARAAVRRIADDGIHGGQVIESIRAIFAKGMRDRLTLDINALIMTVAGRSQHEARLGEIEVETDLARSLPPVTGNPTQLQQVIANLISNAFEAMDPVSDRPRVLTLRTSLDQGQDVLVSVEDTGIGLRPEDGERVLEPFFSTKAHGMGMGLTICTSILESHGGRIWAGSRTPHGAIFRFSLPAAIDGGA